MAGGTPVATGGLFNVLGCLGRRHAGDGLSGRHGALGPQRADAAHQSALSPEWQAAGRSHARRALLRQGRDAKGSGGGARRQRHVLNSAQRAQLRNARRLHGRRGHQRRLVLPAHAPARQGHEDDRDVSRWPPRDAAERAGLRLQLAIVLLPEAHRAAAARARASTWWRTTTTRPRTSTIPIRPKPSPSAKDHRRR